MPINHPAELPEGGEGGGSGTIRRPGGIGGPNEMPVNLGLSYRYLLDEIFSLRNRVHSLESTQLATRLGTFSAAGIIGGPQEMPEGGEGGGGTGIFRPPKGNPPEMPGPMESQFAKQMATLTDRLTALESKLTQSLQNLQVKIDGLRK